jgi:hypothetical protein
VTSHSPFIAHYRKREPKEQSLENHLTGVADLAAGFAARIGLRKQGELLGLFHDLGKYSAEFQNYLKSAVGLLTTELIRDPSECIDYVLLHELCHLKEHNHGPRFHRLLDRHMPEWRRIKTRLDAMAEALVARYNRSQNCLIVPR